MYMPAMWLWPYTVYSMWLNAVMGPWMQMSQAAQQTGLPPAAAAVPAAVIPAAAPAAAVGLDPVSPEEMGTSATDFRPEVEKQSSPARLGAAGRRRR